MRRHVLIVAAVAVFLIAGCSMTPGRSRSLGEIDYSAAFAAANEVMAQYYSIESANPRTGVIQARPRDISADNERILGGSPARQLATLRLRTEGESVVAYASVALQRQGAQGLRQFQESYDSVPNETPAESDAATTADQNDTWTTHSYAHNVERRILQDIHRALNPTPE